MAELFHKMARAGWPVVGIAQALNIVHLLNHEQRASESAEAEVAHLSSALRWSPAHAQRIIRTAMRAGLIERRADRLVLTEAGRASAQRALARASADQR